MGEDSLKKFVDSEFVKTCRKHIINSQIRSHRSGSLSEFSNRSESFQSIYHRTKRQTKRQTKKQAKRRRISPRIDSKLPDSTEIRFETELPDSTESGELGGIELKCQSHAECHVRYYLYISNCNYVFVCNSSCWVVERRFFETYYFEIITFKVTCLWTFLTLYSLVFIPV